MDHIETAILNCYGIREAEQNMVFAARLTQHGHTIQNMADLMDVYRQSYSQKTVENIAGLPHPTVQKFMVITVAVASLLITGVSEKVLKQMSDASPVKAAFFGKYRPNICSKIFHRLATSWTDSFVRLIYFLHYRNSAIIAPVNFSRIIFDCLLTADWALFFICLYITVLTPHKNAPCSYFSCTSSSSGT